MHFSVSGQTFITNNEIAGFKNIPQEKIFAHHNTSFLLTGEFLFYKVYCLNNKTENLSTLSKIAYVELVGTDNTIVFKHKIILNNGMGQGDFFVPTTVNSGNYKLIAYTQWMKNVENNYFFQDDISIINPFQSNQTAIIDNSIDNADVSNNNPNQSIKNFSNESKFLGIQTNKQAFKNREKVNLKIESLQGENSFGDYSISVRKIETISIPQKHTSYSYTNLFKDKNATSKPNKDSQIYLPELRGEIISGRVFSKETALPILNAKVGVSIAGKESLFKVANTNELGIFYLNVEKDYDSQNAIIQVISDNRDAFRIEIDQLEAVNYQKIDFFKLKITSEQKEYILNHSIYNQIENTYSNVKPNQPIEIDSIIPFFNSKEKTYLLDDYTRFPTLKETVIEIIPEVFIRQRKGINQLHVKLYDEDIESGLNTLVLVDGIMVQDQNDLVLYNTAKIKKISVVSEQYFYGSEIFEGIVSIETFEGDFNSIPNADYIKSVKLFKPLQKQSYFEQKYIDETYDRIPDFRRQLLWNPAIQLNKNDKTITFFTSDVNGKYEICLEGFTTLGKPVSLKKVISVSDNLKE